MVTLPFYIGYAMIGVVCFSDKDDFSTFQKSLRTLFALVNGDSILLEFQLLCTNSSTGYCAMAYIYLYTFCIVFITTVLNVFIFIIEGGA